MWIVGRVRPLVCLLLAVSTAIGAAVPARACGCTPAGQPAPARSPGENHPAQDRLPAAAKKTCCQTAGANKACCAKARNAGQTSCCAASACPTHPAPSGDQRGCSCVTCDCGSSPAPAAPPTPAQSIPDAGEQPGLDSAIPPVLVPTPADARPRIVHPVSAHPPDDLVISLSRLTC